MLGGLPPLRPHVIMMCVVLSDEQGKSFRISLQILETQIILKPFLTRSEISLTNCLEERAMRVP